MQIIYTQSRPQENFMSEKKTTKKPVKISIFNKKKNRYLLLKIKFCLVEYLSPKLSCFSNVSSAGVKIITGGKNVDAASIR